MKNNYIIEGDVVKIILKKINDDTIYEGLIDLEDLERVKALNLSWHLKWENHTKSYYVKATRYLGIIDGKAKYETVHLHRVIMNCYKREQVPNHKSHNTLDNRKNNLEILDVATNTKDRLNPNSNTSTGVRNVSWSKKNQKYIVQLQVNGKNKCFGRFDTLEEAKQIAEIKRKEIYGKL